MRLRSCCSRTSRASQLQASAPVVIPCHFQRSSHRSSTTGHRINRRGAGPSRVGRLSVVAFRESNDGISAPTSSRSHATVEHVPVAVDYYRLLQVPRVSRPDAIRKAYDQAMKQPPATAYSADTLFARAVLLKAAAESLIDPDLRRSYDAKLAAGHSALRVSQQDMPGALVVLQEIGEFQLVLDLGNRWLDLNGSQPDAGDVAAAVALAYCDRAGERLTAPENQGAVLPACDDLDAALAKLRRYGMAQQLQTQIVSALRDLAPEYACELAALPLGTETAARRAKGVALMRSVLRSAAATAARNGADMDDPLLPETEDPRSVIGHARRMLQRSRDVLTCSEQVSLLPDALRGSGFSPHPDVLYDGALAHIVDGFRNGWPHSVHTADQLLRQLEVAVARQAAAQREKADLAAAAAARRVHYSGAAAASTPGVYHYDDLGPEGAGVGVGGGGAAEAAPSPHAGGVALERAVCAVLLGDYVAAARLLGLDGSRRSAAAAAGMDCELSAPGSPPPADEQLRSFVMEYAPSGTQDLRPGLRALAARWLEGVALASFRDTAGQPVIPLDKAWFTDPRVTVYVQVWRLCRNEHVLAATHFLCNLVPNIIRLFADASIKVAAAAALAAARAQRISDAVAAAAAASSKRRAPPPLQPVALGGSGLGRSASPSPRLRPSRALAADPAEAPTAATPAAAAAAAAAPPMAPSTRHGASAAPGPFGHPYGKSVRETDHASISRSPGLYRDNHRGATPAAPRNGSSGGGSGGGSAAVGVGFGAAGTAAEAAAAAAAGPASEFRRRFAASAAVDAAVTVPSEYDDVHGRRRGHADTGSDVHEDPELDEDLDEHPVELAPEGLPRRGMTEQDLRAHLAGLEAAMWDSELPDTGAAKKRLAMWGVAAVAVLAALFHFVFRRPDAAASRPAPVPTPPAVVSITISAFAAPN